MAKLSDPVTMLKGVGEVRSKQLAQLNIFTLRDLICHFPRGYEDRTKLVPIEKLEPDVPACFRAMVMNTPRTSHIRKGLDLTKVQLADTTGRLNVTFFNNRFAAQQLEYGREYIFYGAVSGDFIGYSMTNPVFETPESQPVTTRRILPIYPLTAGLTNAALLTGSMAGQQKKDVRERVAAGEVQVVIGTHALLSESTRFDNLGLVITDEQHRFGVGQRSRLSAKGEDPHLLVMSATPIPRTLALILYGDLDVSVLDELPPGREPVDTFLVGESYRPRINAFIRKQVSEGHQCFVVCPAVEENEELGIKAASVWADTLQQTVFPDLRIALLHGQMKGAEKEAAMASFARGEADVMVATTVIEVGVDVPNATLMVIEDADRFGLSQLHQLRGRVGRGKAKSYCILTTHNRNPETLQRLKALCKTADGFKIAEEDLRLRGPGDFFGSRQSGLPAFRVADLGCDLAAMKDAQQASADWIDAYGTSDTPEANALRQRIGDLFARSQGTMN